MKLSCPDLRFHARTSLLRLAAVVVIACSASSSGAEPKKPNIILILADDLGYGELGCFGQKVIQTPHLDRMAAEGMRFTQFYAGTTVCAPSRSVLLTGQHMGHTRVRGNGGQKNMAAQTLRDEDITVAEVLKTAGYRTALIGKWGLGEAGSSGDPSKQGFDYYFGYLNQTHAHNYWPESLLRNGETVPLGNRLRREGKPYENVGAGIAETKAEYAHDLLVYDALNWIGKQGDAPFFLYLALTLPHANNEATRLSGNGNEVPDNGIYEKENWPVEDKAHAAMVSRLDSDVGRLLQRLKDLGRENDTLVIFSSDNGPHKEGGHSLERFRPSGPLRGIKRDLYEGGIRVPTIARWPGTIAPGGIIEHAAYFGDFMATAAEVAKVQPPENIDSVSLVPTFIGNRSPQLQGRGLYWEFYEGGFSQAALLDGRWKGVRNKRLGAPLEVYDLLEDIGETRNVAEHHPEIAKRLREFFTESHVDSAEWPVRENAVRAAAEGSTSTSN